MSRAQQHEQRLEQAHMEDDPLDVFLQYIAYLQSQDPQRIMIQGKSAEELLAQVLNRCAQQFKYENRYKQDSRYLKVWLQFAKKVNDPVQVYEYVLSKGIGTELASLYEQYAAYLDSNHRKDKAIRILEKGVEVKAQPLTRLQSSLGKIKGDPAELSQVPVKAPLVTKGKRPERYGFDLSMLQVNGLNISFEELRAQRYYQQQEKLQEEAKSHPMKYCSDDEDDDFDDYQYGTQTNVSRMTGLGENEIDRTCTIVSQAAMPVQNNLFNLQLDVYVDPEDEKPLKQPVQKKEDFKSKASRKLSFAGLLLQPGNIYNDDELISPVKQASNNSNGTSPDVPQQDDNQSPFNDDVGLRTKLSSLKVDSDEEGQYVQSEAVGRKSNVNVMTPIIERSECNTTLSSHSNYKSSSSSGPKNVLSSLYRTNTQKLTSITEADTATLTLGLKDGLALKDNKTVLKQPRQSFHIPDYGVNDTVNATRMNVGEMYAKDLQLDPTSQIFEWPDQQTVIDLVAQNRKGSWSQNSMFHDLSGQVYAKGSILKKNFVGKINEPIGLVLGSGQYTLQRKIGDGTYGIVYLARCKDENEMVEQVAMKVHQPSCAWEFHIMNELQLRLEHSSEFAQVRDFYLYQDESYLVMDYLDNGTLLDVVNKNRSSGGIDDLLCMHFTVQLIKIIQKMHQSDIIHGDVKVDNFMLRKDKQLMVIDFGQSVDLKLTGSQSLNKCSWTKDSNSKTCNLFEDRLRFPWNFDLDYIGLAGCVYVMLFGKYCELPGSIKKDHFDLDAYRQHLKYQNYKRSSKELWIQFFDACLQCDASQVQECMLNMQQVLQEQAAKLTQLIQKL